MTNQFVQTFCLVLVIWSTWNPTAVAFQCIGFGLAAISAKSINVRRYTTSRIETQHIRTTSLPSQSKDDTELSPWSPGKWKITLQFKREEESSETNDSSRANVASINKLLGEGWGTNSAQLALSVCVQVTAEVSENVANAKQSIQSAWLGGKPRGSVECIPQNTSDKVYHSTYINNEGQQNVQIASGQWRIEPPMPLITSSTGKPLPGQASTLRFSLTIKSAIKRNSIILPENQLLLLQSNTFREEQFEDGIRTLLPFQSAKDNAQRKLDEQLDHESGDRRLDGKDLIPLLEGYKDVAGLLFERDEKYRKWKDIEGVLPCIETSVMGYNVDAILDDDSRWGVWPGDTDLLTIERGFILAVVEKKDAKGGAFPWMESKSEDNFDTVIVGSWSAAPIWDDDEV